MTLLALNKSSHRTREVRNCAPRRWSLRVVTSKGFDPSTTLKSHLLFQLLLPQIERRHFARKIGLSGDNRQRFAAPAADKPALFTPNTLVRSRYLGNRSPRALLPSRLSRRTREGLGNGRVQRRKALSER